MASGPEHYREAERLLAGAQNVLDVAPVDGLTRTECAALAQVHATLALAASTMSEPAEEQPAATGLTVYRASHESIVMGLYTTEAVAREHCVAELRREWPSSVLGWIEDEEDGVAELVATNRDGEETETGYAVTALEVAAAYDPEADT